MQLISYERGNEKNSTFSLVTGNQTTFSKDYISDTLLNHTLLYYLEKKKNLVQFLLPKSDFIEVNRKTPLILLRLNFTLFKVFYLLSY